MSVKQRGKSGNLVLDQKGGITEMAIVLDKKNQIQLGPGECWHMSIIMGLHILMDYTGMKTHNPQVKLTVQDNTLQQKIVSRTKHTLSCK